MNWLWSTKAIQCHILFGGAGVIFVSLCFGSKEELQKSLPGNDWIWLLLFLVVGYPVVLFLLWAEQKATQREAFRERIASLTEPEKEKARRIKWRLGSLVVIAATGASLIYYGHKGLLTNGIPAQFLGYAFLGMTVLGICGVNIWYGGPIDPRFDPQNDNPTDPHTIPDQSTN